MRSRVAVFCVLALKSAFLFVPCIAAVCPDGMFQNSTGSCVQCAALCAPGWVEAVPCNTSNDRECAQCDPGSGGGGDGPCVGCAPAGYDWASAGEQDPDLWFAAP